MLTRMRSRITYPHVVSTLALFVALGGGAYAASKIGTQDLKDQAVTNPKIEKNTIKGNRIAKNTIKGKKIDEDTLGQVPDAAALDGQGAEDFVPAFTQQRFNVSLAFGQSQEIVNAGSLRVAAQCIQNATDNNGNANRDIARLLISTVQSGAVFEGNDTKDGTDATDFLNVDTPEADRILEEHSIATGTSDFSNNGDFGARDPSGVNIMSADDHLNFTVNLFGAACTFAGVTEIVVP